MSATHCFVGAANVIVAMYSGSPEAGVLETRVPWIKRAIERYGGIGQLVVVTRDASGSLPDREFRETSRAQADLFRGSILFSASVIEGDGVHHALVRTFMRGLALVAGKNLEVRLFDRVPPAAEWASSIAAPYGGPSALDLIRIVEQLRASHAAAV